MNQENVTAPEQVQKDEKLMNAAKSGSGRRIRALDHRQYCTVCGHLCTMTAYYRKPDGELEKVTRAQKLHLHIGAMHAHGYRDDLTLCGDCLHVPRILMWLAVDLNNELQTNAFTPVGRQELTNQAFAIFESMGYPQVQQDEKRQFAGMVEDLVLAQIHNRSRDAKTRKMSGTLRTYTRSAFVNVLQYMPAKAIRDWLDSLEYIQEYVANRRCVIGPECQVAYNAVAIILDQYERGEISELDMRIQVMTISSTIR
jgi:hypothetical protein